MNNLPTLQTAGTSLATGLLKALIEEVRALQKPWAAMNETEQQRCIDYLAAQVDMAVTRAVRDVAGMGFTHFGAQLESLNVKDGMKAVLKLPTPEHDVEQLLGNVSSVCVLVLVDHAVYVEGVHQVKADPDQPGLPLGDPDESAAETPDEVAPVEAAPAEPQLITATEDSL